MQAAIRSALKKARWQAGMTQKQLADASGLSRSTISNIECGTYEKPYGRTLYKVAEALGVDLDELLTETAEIAS